MSQKYMHNMLFEVVIDITRIKIIYFQTPKHYNWQDHIWPTITRKKMVQTFFVMLWTNKNIYQKHVFCLLSRTIPGHMSCFALFEYDTFFQDILPRYLRCQGAQFHLW